MYKPSRDEYLCAPKKCTKMFIMALFITEKKTGNNPKSINNRINKEIILYCYNGILYTMKGN